MDSIVEKIEFIRTGMARHNKTYRWLGSELGVHHTTLSHILGGKGKRGTTNKPWLDDAVKIFEEIEKKFSTPAQLTGKEQTGVYYNSNREDSASGFDPAALFRAQQVTAWVINPNSAWSAKSMSTKLFTISAFPGAAGLAIQFTEEFAGFRRGSVFFFRETSYPSDGIILLLESISGDQAYRIGWIDPSISGSDIQSGEGVIDLAEWKLTHYCFAVGWGPGDQVNDGKWSSNGIPFR